MELKKAISLGTTAFGIIKCTYASLYNKDGKVLFSVQTKDASYNKQTIITKESGKEKIIWQVPIVKTTSNEDKKYIPVDVTEECIRVIEEKINKKPEKEGWQLLKIKGDLVDVVKTLYKPALTAEEIAKAELMSRNDPEYYYKWEKLNSAIWSDRYRQLIELIESGEPLYVKPVALEWYPDEAIYTFVDNEGELRNINVEIEKVKMDLEKARRLVIFAGGATIL